MAAPASLRLRQCQWPLRASSWLIFELAAGSAGWPRLKHLKFKFGSLTRVRPGPDLPNGVRVRSGSPRRATECSSDVRFDNLEASTIWEISNRLGIASDDLGQVPVGVARDR
jgi:hypothetical protein